MQITTLKKTFPKVKIVQYATTVFNNCYQAILRGKASTILEDKITGVCTVQKTGDNIGLSSMIGCNA